jgi:hypothetical protein
VAIVCNTQELVSSSAYDRYNIYVLRGSKPGTAMTYQSQNTALRTCPQSLGIQSHWVTHIGRGVGARDSEKNGAPDSATNRAGRWNQNSKDGAYLSVQLPMPALRALTGLRQNPKDYFLLRAEQQPSEDLLSDFFPWIRESAHQIGSTREVAGQGIRRC